ncbi:MAG: response regulator [Epsilonproteobacteria bacterium]|nr:response regulator [Campylobacterota bacterium]
MKKNKRISLSSFFSYIKHFFIKEDKKTTTDDEKITPPSEENKNNNTISTPSKQSKNITKKKQKNKNNNKLPTFNNLKALIVEDNPINQKMIQYTLKNIGIDCDMASNGSIGVDMRKENHYDIIFMDIQMPVMNGVEATKAILEYEKEKNLPHIPIIAVTANALKGDREKFLAEGMDEYVSKPVDFNRLVDVLQEFCSDKLVSNDTKDILLYKKTQTEAKIISAILEKLGYSVDVAKTIEEFKKGIDFNTYHSIIIDKVCSDIIHQDITQKIKSKNIPSLLFVDKHSTIISSDKEAYTHITNKLTDFKLIQEKVDSMMKV